VCLKANWQKAICAANMDMTDMNNMVSFFHTKLNQRIDSAGACVASTVAYHQTRFQEYIKSNKKLFQDKIETYILEAVQVAIDEQIALTNLEVAFKNLQGSNGKQQLHFCTTY
jgi:NAD/NADP transhydrogenase beta subunit